MEIGTIDIGNGIRELWPAPQMAPLSFNPEKKEDPMFSSEWFQGAQGAYLYLDGRYWAHSEEGWATRRKEVGVDVFQYLPSVGDCDDFAWLTKAYVGLIAWRMSQLEKWPEDQRLPPALGLAAVFNANGSRTINHAILYYVQDDGHDDRYAPHVRARKTSLWGWEPQNDIVWRLRPRPYDWPYFIIW